MPIHIDQLITNVTVSTDELPLDKKQRDLLIAKTLSNAEKQAIERQALADTMRVPLQARPQIRPRK